MLNERPTRRPVTIASLWVRNNVITTVLLIFIVASLVLHGLTIMSLLRVRAITSQQLDISTRDLARLRQQRINYIFPIDENITIDTTVTIDETISVPISLTVPISETLRYPISTPAGEFEIPIPINLTVPISETVDVPIRRQIPIQADVPVQTELPVDLDLSQPPIGDILQQFEDALRALRESL